MDQRNDVEGFFHPNGRKLKRSFAERTIDSLDVSDCGSDLGIGGRAKEAGLLRMRAIEYEMGRHRPWNQPKPTCSASDNVPTDAHFLEVAEEGRVRQRLARVPKGVSTHSCRSVLRIYFLQHWFNLSEIRRPKRHFTMPTKCRIARESSHRVPAHGQVEGKPDR
jgi:hypothetical protein